jgi:hypothetical protein
LVALGFDQDEVSSGFIPDQQQTDQFGQPQPWQGLLILLARREAARDTEPGKIIAALLDLLTEAQEDRSRLANERLVAESETERIRRDRRQLAEDRDHLRHELGQLQEISRTTENAALVGHQVGAFIDAGRKIIKVSELDLPPEWQGPCDRGPCAANDGHDGTCAEASGWAAGDR